MPRAVWTGAISFGLVNVPIKLCPAVREQDVKFNQLNGKTGARIKQQRIDATTGEEVPFDDIVKGYEIAPDRYIVIEPAELDAIEARRTRTIDIECFVDGGEIDPLVCKASYYVVPDAGGAIAYRLLIAAMRESGKVGIGRVVMRSKLHLAALRATGDALTLTMLLWADEILPAPEAGGEPVSDAELSMARALIESLSGSFDHATYVDSHREQVLALIEAKAGGQMIEAPEAEAEPEPELPGDLMAALEASLMAAVA